MTTNLRVSYFECMMMKNLGNLLKSTRQSKNFELKKVATILKIQEKYLQAVEEGDLSEIADKIYLYGCIKNYANWLGLDGEELASRFKQSKRISYSNIAMSGRPGVWYAGIFSLTHTKMYVASILVILLAYGILYHIKPISAVVPLYHPVVKKEITEKVLTSLEGKELFFVAEREVRITIIDTVNIISTIHYLPKGEVMFITYRNGLKLTADCPENIDIFLGGKKEIFLGKMKEIFG